MSSPSPLALINLQASALFVSNHANRLQYIREPGYPEAELPSAPRFFMGRTLEGNIWRFREDLPDALVAELDAVCKSEPIANNLCELPQTPDRIRALLHGHAPVTHEERGPAFWIPAGDHSISAAITLTEADLPALATHYAWKHISLPGYELGPTAAVIIDGVAVSMCFCSRIIDQVAEAGIGTIESERGKGYASAVAGDWAAAVRQSGRIPLYSTSWNNLASQGVARHLGMVCYGDDWSIA